MSYTRAYTTKALKQAKELLCMHKGGQEILKADFRTLQAFI